MFFHVAYKRAPLCFLFLYLSLSLILEWLFRRDAPSRVSDFFFSHRTHSLSGRWVFLFALNTMSCWKNKGTYIYIYMPRQFGKRGMMINNNKNTLRVIFQAEKRRKRRSQETKLKRKRFFFLLLYFNQGFFFSPLRTVYYYYFMEDMSRIEKKVCFKKRKDCPKL